MFMPRFTVRRLLTIVTALSFFFLVLSFAVQGSLWAIAIASVGGSLALSLLFYALFFQIAYVWASIAAATRPKKPQSPFAHEAPPPRYVLPTDPE